MNLQELEAENVLLRRKLSIAKMWMEREVRSQVKKISKRKVSKMTCRVKDMFFSDNVEEIIIQKVTDFFGELMLLNIPASVVDNIISAEINYFNLRENPSADGLGVITSYHKSLDILIETFITKGFRKFAKKNKQTQLRQNNTLEKALNSVVNKGYILSVGRLYHLIKLIKNDEKLYDYGKCFKDYLKKYNYIGDIIFKKEFIDNFKELIDSEILGKKRHSGKIDFVETREARRMLIGNFKQENCLIFKFIEIGKVEI